VVTGESELLPPPELTVLTGGAGWFGRAFLDALARPTPEQGPVARDGRVRVLAAHPREVPAIVAVLPRAVVHVGDVADPGVLADLFRGAAGCSVVHAAGVIHPVRTSEFERVNHGGTKAVLAAAARGGARRVVHLSSNSPFGTNPVPQDAFRHHEPFRPSLGYGHSKMCAEMAVRGAHERGEVPTVIVRPPWFYGPWQPERQTTFFAMVAGGRFPVPGEGTQRRSMTYVDNLVQGVALAERHPEATGQAFWVADRDAYPLVHVVETVRRVLAEEGYRVRHGEIRLPRRVSAVARLADRVLQERGRYSSQVHVLGELDSTISCDISRTVEVLGYDPKVTLDEGMRRSVRWCRRHGIDIAPRSPRPIPAGGST
jgi:nucleoside-diphosphate-sugar epimerase